MFKCFAGWTGRSSKIIRTDGYLKLFLKNMKDAELIAELKKLANNLLWMSESDYPFQVLLGEDKKKLLPEDPEAAIEVICIDDFFAPALRRQNREKEEDLAELKQYQSLIDFLKTNLKDIKVYRIGSIEIDIYIIGKTESGNYAGLLTKAIET